MNWIEFGAVVIGATAWPTAFVVAAILFRGEVRGLLGRIRSGEVMGTKFTFGDALSKVEEEREVEEQEGGPDGEQRIPHATNEPVFYDERFDPLAKDAQRNPSYGVITSWELVSQATRDLIGTAMQQLGEHATGGMSRQTIAPRHALVWLARRRLIPDTFLARWISMLELRNAVAHGDANPTPGEAVAYVENADALTEQVRRLTLNLLVSDVTATD